MQLDLLAQCGIGREIAERVLLKDNLTLHLTLPLRPLPILRGYDFNLRCAANVSISDIIKSLLSIKILD
uniref:Uncharacterized protein n=1 Tax=Oryza meridionalis TaxID=40149 RepID=A0A0E0EQQ8_9ORYZ